MQNVKNRTVHLTVSSKGVVSLWDTAAAATTVKDEVYVALELTAEQYKQLLVAQSTALLLEVTR